MYEEIDWNEMWKKAVEESRWKERAGTPEFWDDRVDRFEEMIRRSNREGMIMKKIEIEPDYTVLDIGAGPGTVAVPLAKVVKSVTAVEPSNGMLSRLNENASKEKLANITCINKKWEDVELRKDIEEHDIVVASHSLRFMKDIRSALSKMDDTARKCVYLFVVAGRRKNARGSLFSALFRRGKPGPDYIYLHNILYQLGIYANVEIINADRNMQFPDMDAAIQHYKEWMDIKEWRDISEKDEEKLRSYLTEKLVEEDGVLWSKHKLRTAMVWWRKE
jgi:FkbM family methyltransferase